MAKSKKKQSGLSSNQQVAVNQISQAGMNIGMGMLPHVPVPVQAPVMPRPVLPKPAVRIPPVKPQNVMNSVSQAGMQIATGALPHMTLPHPINHTPLSSPMASLPLRYNPDRSTMIRTDTPAPIAQQQKHYQVARANSDYLGMRKANDAANAYRQKHGMNPYLSTVGDLQYKKTIDRSAQSKPSSKLRNFQADHRAMYDQYTVDSGKKMAKSNFWHTVEGIYQGLSPVDLKPQLAATYGQDVADQITQNKMNMAGNIAGTLGQFAIPYGALEGLVAKSGKVAKAGGIIGNTLKKLPNISEKTADALGHGIAKSITKDILAGAPLNANIALNKEHLTGPDAAKNIALNSGMDMVTGGLMEAVPYAFKAFKNRKLTKMLLEEERKDVNTKHVLTKASIQPNQYKLDPNGKYQYRKPVKSAPLDTKLSIHLNRKGEGHTPGDIKTSEEIFQDKNKIPMKTYGTNTQPKEITESKQALQRLRKSVIEQPEKGKELKKNSRYIKGVDSKKELKKYSRYIKDVDSKMVQYSKGAKKKRPHMNEPYLIGGIEPKTAKQLADVTSRYVGNYSFSADSEFFRRTNRLHGKNGTLSQTMANENDIGRLGHVLRESDTIEPVYTENGRVKRDKRYSDGMGSYAPVLRFKKRIGNQRIVVEAVPDAKRKLIRLLSAHVEDSAGNLSKKSHVDENLLDGNPKMTAPDFVKTKHTKSESWPPRTSYISADTVSKGMERPYKKFLDAHDDGIVQFAQAAKEKRIPQKSTYAIGVVQDKDVDAIKNITGVDTSGFGISADKDSFVHIENRHGENGSQDRSMSNPDDLARIPYIIKTSDSIEQLFDKRGNIARSRKYRNSDGTNAIAVQYKKRVDGHFFVVSAVPDTGQHEMRIMSAYIKKAKKEAHQVPNMPFDQRLTSETLASDASSIDNVPHSDGKVNTESKKLVTTPIMKHLEEYNKAIGAQNASNLKTMADNIKRYGAIKPGMNPRRNIKIAKATKFGETMLHARTLAESKAVDKKLLKSIKQGILEGDFGKSKVKNQVLVDNASNMIKEQGADQALGAFKTAFDDGKTGAEHAALGYRLLQELQKTGDIKSATEVASRLADMMSANGRKLQAASIIKRLSPEGRLISITRTANKMSEEFSKKLKGKKIKVPEDILKDLANAKTENDIVKARHKAQVALWDQVPPTLKDKINAWRYIAMLGNPKTHIRNIDGNVAFMPLRQTKDAIGAALEKMIPVEQRTKAILNPLNKLDGALIRYAKKDFDNVKNILKSGGKYDDFMTRDLDSKVFNFKPLEKFRKWNGDLLDAEDTIFMKQAYTSSLAQWIKARKLNHSDLTEDILNNGRKYAINEALKATYRDANSFAEAMSKIERKLTNSNKLHERIGGGAIGAVFPFKKTPLNIIKRGFSYSPFGILRAAAKYGEKLKGGEMDVTQVIDDLSAGLSGTAITALGAWMGHMGIAIASAEHPYSTRAGKFDDMLGAQEYSLNFGGKSYTMDWAAPSVLPFFTGVEADQIARNKGMGFGNLMDALSSLSEPMLNLSMLQGVNSLVKTGYDDNALATLAGKTAQSFAGQFVPTALGQVARTIDDTRRSTVSTKQSASGRGLEKFKNQQLAKIPVVSKTLEPYVDLWGREQKTGSLGERAATNFLSPGYYSEDKSTPVDKEIKRLAGKMDSETANAVYPPATGQYDVKIDGEKYRMSPKELTAFKKTRGQAAYKDLSDLFKSPEYKKMDADDQAKAVSKVYQAARKDAVEGLAVSKGISPIRLLSKSKQAAYESVKGSVSEKEFLAAYKATGTGKSGVEKATALLEHGTKKKALYNALGVNDSTLVKALALKNTGVPMDDYKKASVAVKKWTKLAPKVKEANGGKLPVNTSSSAKKMIIDKYFPNYSKKQKIAMYNAFGVSKTLW